jgi:hypothetical protein
MSRRPARALAGFAAAGLLGGGISVGGALTAAVPAAAARAGCYASQVAVVVDFTQFGRGIVRGCSQYTSGLTGFQAMHNAGFATTGTTHDGPGFICRIGVGSGTQYPTTKTEKCVRTPPASAYWSYWHATRGHGWTYSRLGAMSAHPQQGSVDAWVFKHPKDEPPGFSAASVLPSGSPPAARGDSSPPAGGSGGNGSPPREASGGGGAGTGGSHTARSGAPRRGRPHANSARHARLRSSRRSQDQPAASPSGRHQRRHAAGPLATRGHTDAAAGTPTTTSPGAAAAATSHARSPSSDGPQVRDIHAAPSKASQGPRGSAWPTILGGSLAAVLVAAAVAATWLRRRRAGA